MALDMKPFYWLALGATVPIALFLMIAILDTACSLDALKAAGETRVVCYRNWIGALSGWAAALAAGVTILVLLLQIRSNERVAHRQQTEAKEVFDREISDTLEIINDVWKHVEDTYGNTALTRADFDDAASKVQIILSRISQEHKKKIEYFQTYIRKMHSQDATQRARLLENVQFATSPFKTHYSTANAVGVENKISEGENYIRMKKFTFIECFARIGEVSPEFERIFQNRVRTNEFDEDDIRISVRGTYLGSLPNNPDNPY
jgi:hypothetical protein